VGVRILGLDTATRCASVGVLIDGRVVAEESEVTGSHAASLLPLIDGVLMRAGCTVRDLDAIAVSSGPGSFTGLRVAMSVAKGLACAAGLRVVGVPTLEALARSVAQPGTICALLDARKGELYAAWFEFADGTLRRLAADALLTPEQLVALVPAPCVFVGDAVEAYGDLLRGHFGTRATVLPFPSCGPRGGVIAALGLERVQAGQVEDLLTLEPCYIRPSEAERNAS
jgi:tRNA threonylcarbamoyladenosine biosynthesis protein TsaB